MFRLASVLYPWLPPAWGLAGRHPRLVSHIPELTPCIPQLAKLSTENPPPPRDALSLWLQKEKLSAQASLKRHTSLNDLSLTRDEQEIEFLRLQVLEQQHVIDDLSLVRLLSAGALGVAPSDTVPGLARRLRAG